MNLYALIASYAPGSDVRMFLAPADEEALEHGVFVAAHDAVNEYGSPGAGVYCIARDVDLIGSVNAIDAPAAWDWAHPGVEIVTAMADVHWPVKARSGREALRPEDVTMEQCLGQQQDQAGPRWITNEETTPQQDACWNGVCHGNHWCWARGAFSDGTDNPNRVDSPF